MGIVATIRPACDGLFGPCVAVEEATSNLLAGKTDFITGWTAYSGASVTVVPGHADPLGGNAGVRIQTSGGTSTTKYYASAGVGTNGQNYALSVYVHVNAGSAPVTIDDNHGNVVTFSAGDGWQRAELQFVGDGIASVQLKFRTASPSDSLDFYAWGPQIETKAFCTSFTETSRGDGNLTYPVNILSPSAGTIAVWFRSGGTQHSASSATYSTVFRVQDSATTNALALRRNLSSTDWNFIVGNATAYDVSPPVVLQDGWHLAVLTWDLLAGQSTAYIDGSVVHTFGKVPVTFQNAVNGALGVGMRPGYGDPLNSVISNLIVLRHAADQNTISEWYSLQKPFFDPAPVLSVPAPWGVSLSVA